jgi:D-alanyl-D-alanine carboxypeptidase/D-alanyl-D-alanine-endopeptidase (penicillin-binding protein 4)
LKLILWGYFLLTLSIYALPQTINNFIKKSTIPPKDISIYIKEVGENGRVIISHNATKTRTPASVIKVLSTYAAVLKLGFDYHFPTKFYTTGDLRNGVLNGDLIVKGFGDPTLNSKSLKEIVGSIRARGIRKITGHIVIDRSYFRVGTKDSSGFDEHPYSPYNAMPDAMMFNERVSTICVTPNKNDISKKSADGSYKIINKLQRVNKPCKGRYSWPGVKIDKTKAMPSVLLQGKISQHCGKRNICKVVTKPYKSFYYALKDALKKAGIMVSGNMRLRKVPSNARLIFTHYSKSLEKIVSKTAKKSNNLYARHLLLTLGAKMYGAPATVSKGRKAVENILRSKGALSYGTLSIDNGSGLSRTAKLSAKILADMYDHAYQRYRQRWMQTLSIAGVDGTIKKRFRGTVVKNRAWMKTGTLRRVKNIGGYVKSKSGKLYTVVILTQSNRGAWRASQLQNEIIKWLVTYKGRGGTKPTELHTNDNHLWGMQIGTQNNTTLTKYYVQAGSFSTQPTKSYLLKLERLGLRYKVKYSDKYKVLIGAYGQENDARKALGKVREHINSGAFIVKL